MVHIARPRPDTDSTAVTGSSLVDGCAGLTDDLPRERAVPPIAAVAARPRQAYGRGRAHGFRPVLDGEEMSGLWSAGPALDPQPAFDDAGTGDVAAAFAAWRGECENATALAAATASLNVAGMSGRARLSLRWVMVHMIEEYARHNGHADQLRGGAHRRLNRAVIR
jgi:hypothetical protein